MTFELLKIEATIKFMNPLAVTNVRLVRLYVVSNGGEDDIYAQSSMIQGRLAQYAVSEDRILHPIV